MQQDNSGRKVPNIKKHKAIDDRVESEVKAKMIMDKNSDQSKAPPASGKLLRCHDNLLLPRRDIDRLHEKCMRDLNRLPDTIIDDTECSHVGVYTLEVQCRRQEDLRRQPGQRRSDSIKVRSTLGIAWVVVSGVEGCRDAEALSARKELLEQEVWALVVDVVEDGAERFRVGEREGECGDCDVLAPFAFLGIG